MGARTAKGSAIPAEGRDPQGDRLLPAIHAEGGACTFCHRAFEDGEGTLLLIENIDRPGMIAAYSAALGKNQVNIADMSLSRDKETGKALTMLTLDSTPSAEVIAELEKLPGISRVHAVVV